MILQHHSIYKKNNKSKQKVSHCIYIKKNCVGMIASSKNQMSTWRKKDTKHKRKNAKGKRQGKEVKGVNDNNTTSIDC